MAIRKSPALSDRRTPANPPARTRLGELKETARVSSADQVIEELEAAATAADPRPHFVRAKKLLERLRTQ